jgi:hypothetical protein
MTTESTLPLSQDPIITGTSLHCGRHLSWAAILAGLVAAMALQILFMLLGAALGLAVFSPLTDRDPASNFAGGAVAIEGISAVVSLWFGGWVAGRLTPIGVLSTGWLHGFLVWCSATVVGVFVVSTGAGWAFSGLAKVVGGGLTMAGKPAAAAVSSAADAAKEAAQTSKSTIASFVNEGSSTQTTGSSGQPAETTSAAGIRSKRELGLALTRLFDPSQKANAADNKAAAVKVLVDDAGMSQADAQKEVDDWTASYDRLQAQIADAKNQAEAKAREKADEASKGMAIFSSCSFIAFLIGAAAATWGATHGVRVARRFEASSRVG